MPITRDAKEEMFDAYVQMMPYASESEARKKFNQFMNVHEEKIGLYETWLKGEGKAYEGYTFVPPAALLQGYVNFLRMHSAAEEVQLPDFVPSGMPTQVPAYLATMADSSEVISDDLAQELFGKWKSKYTDATKMGMVNKFSKNYQVEDEFPELEDGEIDLREYLSPRNLAVIKNLFKGYRLSMAELDKMLKEILKAVFATKNVDTIAKFADRAGIDADRAQEFKNVLQAIADEIGAEKMKEKMEIDITKDEMINLFRGKMGDLIQKIEPDDEKYADILAGLSEMYLQEWLPRYQSIPKGSARYTNFISWVVKNYPKNVASVGGPEVINSAIQHKIRKRNKDLKNNVRNCIENITRDVTDAQYKQWLVGEEVDIENGDYDETLTNKRANEFKRRFSQLYNQLIKRTADKQFQDERIEANMFDQARQLENYEQRLFNTTRDEPAGMIKTSEMAKNNKRAVYRLYNEYVPRFIKEMIKIQENAIRKCITKDYDGEGKAPLKFVTDPDDILVWSDRPADAGTGFTTGRLWRSDLRRALGPALAPIYGRVYRGLGPAPRRGAAATGRLGGYEDMEPRFGQDKRGQWRYDAFEMGGEQPAEMPEEEPMGLFGGGCGDFSSTSEEYNWF